MRGKGTSRGAGQQRSAKEGMAASLTQAQHRGGGGTGQMDGVDAKLQGAQGAARRACPGRVAVAQCGHFRAVREKGDGEWGCSEQEET